MLLVLTLGLLVDRLAAAAASRRWAGARHVSWLAAPAIETQITHGARLWLYALAALVLLFLVVPTLIVIPMSFSASQYLEFPPRHWSLRWYQSYFASASWMQATATSFKAAALTTLVATPLGTLAAYGLLASRLPRWHALGNVAAGHAADRAGDPRRHRVFYVYVKLEARQHADRPGARTQRAGDPAGADRRRRRR